MSRASNIVFVGSNPTVHNKALQPFANTRSGKVLSEWIDRMGLSRVRFVNVSNSVTPGNRKLKVSEYELDRLAKEVGSGMAVALGKTAADALRRTGIEFFELPHPSGRNLKLNDKDFVARELARCAIYLASRR